MLRCAMPADDADSPAGAPLFPKADFCSRFEVLVNEVHFSDTVEDSHVDAQVDDHRCNSVNYSVFRSKGDSAQRATLNTDALEEGESVDAAVVLLTPLYKRKYFLSSEGDVDEVDDDLFQKRLRTSTAVHCPAMPAPSVSAPRRASQPGDVSAQSTRFDVVKSVLRPLRMSLALVFAHCHGLPLELHNQYTLEKDAFLLQQPPALPTEEDRRTAVIHFSNIFNAMHSWVANQTLQPLTLNSSEYSLFTQSHMFFDLYSFMWYSPRINPLPPVDLTSKPSWLKHSKSSSNEEISSTEALRRAITKMKIFLILWYIKHGQLIPPHRSVAQIVRSLSIFDFTSSETPPAIFEETSNHLARLLLLCNIDEFFTMLTLFSSKGDPVARLLQESLIEARLAKTSSRFRLQLLNEESHETFLVSLRLAARGARSFLRSQKTSENAAEYKSVFNFSLDILCGDEAAIDWVIHQVFPKCWLSSFTLGLFWRSLKTNKIVTDILRVLPNGIEDMGELVAFFFNSWLEDHTFLKNVRQLKPADVPLASLLSHDVEQLVEFLRVHYYYPVAPILIDLIALDHPFTHSARIACEIYFRQAMCENVPSEVAATYFFRGLLEARRSLLTADEDDGGVGCERDMNYSKVPFFNGTTQLHSVNQQPRRSRYSLHELWETDATAASLDTSETLRPPGSLKNHSDSQQSFDAMLSQEKLQVAVTPFIEGGLKECHDALPSCYAINGALAAMAHLLWKLRLSTVYHDVLYTVQLLDALLTGQPTSVIFWTNEQLMFIAQRLAHDFVKRESAPWEGLLVAMFCETLRSDGERLSQFSLDDGSCTLLSNANGFSQPLDDTTEFCNETELDDSLCTWRQRLRRAVLNTAAGVAASTWSDGEKHSGFIESVLYSCCRKTPNTVFKIPDCCVIPETAYDVEILADLEELLVQSSVRCSCLIFLFLAAAWNNAFQRLCTEEERDVTATTVLEKTKRLIWTYQELIECQDAVAWLLKCILRRYVPVSYFDTAMDLLVTALELDICHGAIATTPSGEQHRSAASGLFSVQQLQQLSAFWTAYTSGMLLEELPVPETSMWSPLRTQSAKQHRLNLLLTKAQMKKSDDLKTRKPSSLKVWGRWIEAHF